MLIAWNNKFPKFMMLRTSHCCHSIIARGRVKPFVWHLNYAIRGTQKNKLPSMLLNCLRWLQTFSTTFQGYIFLWIITTTLHRLMPKLWNQNTVQYLMSMLLSFVRHNNET